MYKITYRDDIIKSSVLTKEFDTFKLAMYFALKFSEGMVLELKWYDKQ
jgi:hypothetical protein